jgi:AmmeMemoRadiSam system protein B
MQIRTPAVAGMFYPGETNELKKTINDCFMHSFGPRKIPPTAISANPITLFIIVGPNHWGIGCNVASMKDCMWETPLGNVEVDSESALELVNLSKIIELDLFSHTKEHSLEVQVPMLQEVYKNKFKILPIVLIDQSKQSAIEVGNAIAKISKKKNAMIIGSSDFTHYEENDFAHKQDKALIEPILNLDVDRFYNVLNKKKVTACGYGAIASTMIACKELGATKGELLKYATSGDITGDTSSVVGYSSIIFT